MKNRIVIGLLVSLMSLNMIGCGEEVIETVETVSVVETESEIVMTEEDYADSLEEIEGGDGEEETTVEETVEETTEEITVASTSLYTIVDCDPVTKYTNTGSNIRSIPDKSGELIDTVVINTELTVTGTTEDGSWSRVEHKGVVCFIKSSLLSDSKTKIQSSNSGNGSGSSNSGSGSSNSGSGSSNSGSNSGGGVPNDPFAGGGTTAGDLPTGGTTGFHTGGGFGGVY